MQTVDEWVGTPSGWQCYIFHHIAMYSNKCLDCGMEFTLPEGCYCPRCKSDQLDAKPAKDIVLKINADTGEAEII